jgi:hypothetical protein
MPSILKRILGITLAGVVLFSIFSTQALAQESDGAGDSFGSDFINPTGVDCFDYYKFQSVSVNVGPNESSFNAGDTVVFSGKIENDNTYPVFDGYVYVRIAQKNPNYIYEGHNIIDEFFAAGPIAVSASSSKDVSFLWKIPENTEAGDYTASYFFSVNKKMNLGGLPFTNEIIVGFSDFSVVSLKSGSTSFVRGSTEVNDEKYNHIGNWPAIAIGEKAKISQEIKNTSLRASKTELTYNLYFWDSLDQKDLISTKTENITLKAGESKILTYEVSKLETSVYYLQIVAKNEDGTKSIVNIRLTSDSVRPRINYFGLNSFPIKKGATTTLYSCFHNTSGISATGTTLLIAKDRSGNEISRVEYSGIITSSISAQKTDFVANSKLEYLKLEQKILDANNNLLDSQEVVYDYDLIKEKKSTGEFVILFAALILGLIILGSLLILSKEIRNNKKIFLTIILIIILLVVGAILFLKFNKVNAVTSPKSFQNSQTYAVGRSFTLAYGSNFENGDPLVLIKDGTVTYSYKIKTSATSSSLKIGDSINFSYQAVGTFNGTGGGWDSPYLGQKLQAGVKSYTFSMEAAKWIPFTETKPYILGTNLCMPQGSANKRTRTDCIGGAIDSNGKEYTPVYAKYDPYPANHRYGYRKQADLPQNNPVVSSDNSVIDCSVGGICRAVGSGTTTLTTTIKPSSVILGYSYPVVGLIVKAGYVPKDRMFRDSIDFPGYTASWVFNVTSDVAPNGSCGSSATATSLIPTTNLCSAGTPSAVSGTGPWSWSCAGSAGGTTALCSANKIVLPQCSNNIIEAGEICDGTSLSGATCQSVNPLFTGGTLSCSSGCNSYDISACTGLGGCIGTSCLGGGSSLNCIGPGGISIANGHSYVYYQNPTVTSPATCASQSENRICTNGTLSGSYTNPTCTSAGTGSTGTCTITSPSGSNAVLNHTTTWSVNSSCTAPCQYIWTGSDLPTAGRSTGESNTLSKIYTTIGMKNISVQVLNSDGSSYCSNPESVITTTTVSMGTSTSNER